MKKAISVILLIAVVVVGAYIAIEKFDLLSDINSEVYVYTDEDEQMEQLKNIELEISDAVVGEAVETAELIVCERDISVAQKWDASWGDWDIFSKTKKIIIHGTGYYVVDLSELSASDIKVDDDKLTVTIDVPDVTLKSVDIDLENTEFEDTQNGLLRFGEIKVTAEQSTIMLAKCEDVMNTKLADDDYMETAQELANTQVTKLFQTVVSSISKDYKVVVK